MNRQKDGELGEMRMRLRKLVEGKTGEYTRNGLDTKNSLHSEARGFWDGTHIDASAMYVTHIYKEECKCCLSVLNFKQTNPQNGTGVTEENTNTINLDS